ncbi:MAG: hypothetical protein RSA29_02260 [Clostridium sp.]|uniref:hypothetical protein n=1 Tax=Clostridium sp. TaxID=1506 RepID=UPI00305915F3
MNKKDIYDTFNDVEFDVSNFEEIPMTEDEKIKLKKSLRKRLDLNKKYINNKRCKVAAMVAIIVLVLGFSPIGQEVIAQITEKLIFTPSQGVIKGDGDKVLYILEEPRNVKIDGKDGFIKSIINDGKHIYVELWSDSNSEKGISYPVIIKEITMKTKDGKTLEVEGSSHAGGSDKVCSEFNFTQNDGLITEFDLYHENEKIDSFTLNKVEFKNGYNEIGGNSTDKDILIGATSYYENGERYFKIWSDREYEDLENYILRLDHINDIEVRDEEGNILIIESANDGTGRAYKISNGYEGKLYIKITNIDLAYEMKVGTKVVLKIPKEGKYHEVNEEIKLKGLDDNIKVTTIENNNGEYKVKLDYSDNYDKDRFVFMIWQSFRSGGSMGGQGDFTGELYLENEDLSVKEKLLKKIYFNIDKVQINQGGNWSFTVE